MQAINFARCGDPESVLEVSNIEIGEPEQGELLVRMLASPINPSDLAFITGKYTTKPVVPQVPGFEGVGVVEKSGGGLRGQFFLKKRVVVINQRGGTWAPWTKVPATQVVPVPATFSDQQAATSFVNPMTAWLLTRDVLQVPRNAWLIQTAAASVVGRMINRLGQHYGFRVLNIVRSDRAAARCQAAGSRHVIRWNEDDDSVQILEKEVRSMIGEAELKYAVDPVGGLTGSAVLSCLTNGGRFIGYGTLSNQPLQVPVRHLMSHQISIDTFWLGHRMKAFGLLRKLRIIRTVQGFIANGVLQTPIASEFSLSNFEAAVTHALSPDNDGRTLLTMPSA